MTDLIHGSIQTLISRAYIEYAPLKPYRLMILFG